jgi:hypothetical protein
MSNDAIGGRFWVCKRMSQKIEQRQGQRGLATWHARTKMANSVLVSPVVHGAYRVCTVADTSTFQVQRLGQGRNVVQMAACQLTVIIATANCLPILN